MARINQNLCEIHTIGSPTRERIVGANKCPEIRTLGISLLGLSEARPPFRFVRPRSSIGQVLICRAGSGNVLINDEWVPCGPGQAYVTPIGELHGYSATGSVPWSIGWVTYGGNHIENGPIGPVRRIQVDPEPLLGSILGLYSESIGEASHGAMHHWLQLVHLYARKIGRPEMTQSTDPRLTQLWAMVDGDLSRAWTLPALAKAVHVSPEQLRRLCQITSGCSPIRQVARLRMQRASSLLTATRRKISDISLEVGYRDAFAFSTAFVRWSGVSPSVFRNRPVP